VNDSLLMLLHASYLSSIFLLNFLIQIVSEQNKPIMVAMSSVCDKQVT